MEKHHQEIVQTDRTLKPGTIRIWKEDSKTKQASESFIKNVAKLWNHAPEYIKSAKTLYGTTSLDRSTFDRIPFVFPTFDRF